LHARPQVASRAEQEPFGRGRGTVGRPCPNVGFSSSPSPLRGGGRGVGFCLRPDGRDLPMSSPAHAWDPRGRWAPSAPGGGGRGAPRRVVPLPRRAGFAATWGEIRRDLRDGPGPSIDRLLRGRAREGVADNFHTVADQLAGGAGEPTRLKAW